MSNTKYCLYARKSSESDERQTMSIDSQIKEMKELAQREKLNIVEVRQESHSAKKSGNRPVFVQLLDDIDKGVFTGILTWAPDRLSRNAGDLGSLVDLMDQGKLHEIKTYSQSFGNNPNEKFLLMILCSQAKLENDNRGINVKRGLKAKCEMGIRPGLAPLGYLNLIKNDRIREIIVDEQRAQFIVQMFERAAHQGHSGRMIKRWLDKIGFTTRSGKPLALSKVFTILKNPFYYGEFEFGGQLYKGNHHPLISKELFLEVQRHLTTTPKDWKKNTFPFKSICVCGKCGASVTAEERIKKLKYDGMTKYVYYHCTRSVDYDCDEPYITEQELISQLLAQLPNIKFNNTKITKTIKAEIERFHRLRSEVLHQEYLSGNLAEIEMSAVKNDDEVMARDYLEHMLKTGSSEDRREAIALIKSRFVLSEKKITLS